MKRLLIFLVIILPCSGYAQGWVIAHRGASAVAPENTISAFTKAIEAGCDCIELDVRMSRDDSIMVIHDETLDRTTNGNGMVQQFSYSELKALSAGYPAKFDSDFENEKIPSLFEVLNMARGKAGVCIDIKNVPENLVIGMVLQMQMDDEVFLMSYNLEKLQRVEITNPQMKTIFIKNTVTEPDLAVCSHNGFSGISASYLFPDYLIGDAHDLGLLFWTGIVSDPAKAEKIFLKGADAVLTNNPGLMTFEPAIEINAFPNPFREYVTVDLHEMHDIQWIIVLNGSGEFVSEFKPPFPNYLEWNVQKNLPTGLYILYFIKAETIASTKIFHVR